MSITVYHYPRCGTCRRALAWLRAHGVEFRAVDIVEEPPSKEALRSLWERSGLPLRKLFNTSGQSYRRGGFKERLPAMSEEEALAALAADGKLIKRPLVDAGERALVGFREEEYEAALL